MNYSHQNKSLKDGFVNRPIERYHNEIREKLKARRELGNDESAQTFSELLKINHNFVKPHEGLDGKTPAQADNIDLNLGKDKYLDLIKQAGSKPNFVNNLGKRIKKVTIVNERGIPSRLPLKDGFKNIHGEKLMTF